MTDVTEEDEVQQQPYPWYSYFIRGSLMFAVLIGGAAMLHLMHFLWVYETEGGFFGMPAERRPSQLFAIGLVALTTLIAMGTSCYLLLKPFGLKMVVRFVLTIVVYIFMVVLIQRIF
jgi:hypothetical protein